MDEKVEKSLENARRFLGRSLQKAGEKDLAEKFDGKMRNASSMGFQVSQLIYQLSSGLQSEAGRQAARQMENVWLDSFNDFLSETN